MDRPSPNSSDTSSDVSPDFDLDFDSEVEEGAATASPESSETPESPESIESFDLDAIEELETEDIDLSLFGLDTEENQDLSEKEKRSLVKAKLASEIEEILKSDPGAAEYDEAVKRIVFLFRDIDKSLLGSIGALLCDIQIAPERIIRFLANEGIEIAAPVLERSPVLNEKEIHNVIYRNGSDHWQSVAKRVDLTDALINALAEKRDLETSIRLIENQKIKLTDKAFDYCLEISKKRNDLSNALAMRADIPERIVVDLYWQVSNDVREKLDSQYKIPKDKRQKALRGALKDFRENLGQIDDPTPTPLMKEISLRYKKNKKITSSVLVKTIFMGKPRFFIALFGEMAGLHDQIIYEAMSQKTGLFLALICRANEINKEDFISIFLKFRNLLEADRNVDSSELKSAIRNYEKVTQESAARIINKKIDDMEEQGFTGEVDEDDDFFDMMNDEDELPSS